MSDLKITRVHKFFWAALVLSVMLLLLLIATGQPLWSQGEEAREIGVGEPGLGAFNFAGHIDQDGFEFVGHGYLYDVQGIAPGDLFVNPANTTETTAHFTYYATATLTSRAIVTDAVRAIFALNSVGHITYYYQATPSAAFDDPESFANGTPIATASIRFQDILSVQGPNRGIAIGNGEFTVDTVNPFQFEGENVRFGRPGLTYQISTFGDGLRTNAVIPQSSVLLAGNAVNTGFRATFFPIVTDQEEP